MENATFASNVADNQTDEQSDNGKERCDKECTSFTTLMCAYDESDISQNQATTYAIITGDNYNPTPG